MSAHRDPSNGRFIARDGLANLVTGAGTTADKRSHYFFTRPYLLPEQVEAAYRSSWMMKKGINLPAKDMTRKRRAWQIDEDSVDKIEKEEKRLKLWPKIRQAIVLGRLGGGLLMMGVGNDDPSQEMNTAALGPGALRYLHVMNRWQVSLGPMIQDPTSDYFGQPEYFQINYGAGGKGQVRVHPSRVVAFRGEPVPNLRGAVADDWFWGDALVLSVQDAVKNAEAAMNGFASLIDEAKVDTVSIPGLTELVSTTVGEANVLKRISVANAMKSMHNTRILDGGRGKDSPGESWETRQINWAGIPDMIRVKAAIVASAFDIPATRFLGKAPDGMNATGDGDESNYLAKIATDQDDIVRPALDQIDAALLPSAGVTLESDDVANYTFPPLKEMSELDEANIFNTMMDAVTKLQATGSVPAVAFDKALQHTAVEAGWLDGLDGALAETPEDERFPSEAEPPADDPSALQTDPGVGPVRKALTTPPMQIAANDAVARLLDGMTQLTDDDRAAILATIGGAPTGDRPFGDAFHPDQPRDEHGRWTATGTFAQHVKRATASGKEHSRTALGKVTEANAAHVREQTGVDIAGYKRVAESSDIRHVINSHGDPAKEAARGQIAVTKAGMREIPNIIENAHTIRAIGASKAAKPQRLEYVATIGGNDHHYVEEIRPHNTLVALKSMLIKK